MLPPSLQNVSSWSAAVSDDIPEMFSEMRHQVSDESLYRTIEEVDA